MQAESLTIVLTRREGYLALLVGLELTSPFNRFGQALKLTQTVPHPSTILAERCFTSATQ